MCTSINSDYFFVVNYWRIEILIEIGTYADGYPNRFSCIHEALNLWGMRLFNRNPKMRPN